MIASYSRNFIFIKTRKTAGTTIEMVLTPFCGDDDIVAPIGKRDELIRGNGRPICRNFSSDPAVEERVRASLLRVGPNMLQDDETQRLDFFNHMDAALIKSRVSPEFWHRAFKFTAERHPYEKAVSFAYFWHRPRKTDIPFSQHLDRVVRTGAYPGFELYSIDGQVVFDDIIRFETLREDLNRIGKRLGIALPADLPRSKHNRRKDHRPAREILSEAQKEIVYQRCRREFDLFGYDV
ncbi:MAG TPA: hypothetical protein VHE09_15335 [Rhizomicrobium sp.]|jgi:hypothetical protein|nr:hypothetical protein [Rhizomicrobium sp.]